MDRVRAELNLEVSGRPAKSTSAIVDKLRRSSMRLTQMQDIAGCRIAVPGIAEQNWLVDELVLMFNMGIVDRRSRPTRRPVPPDTPSGKLNMVGGGTGAWR